MSDNKKDVKVLEEDYDGIIEHDHPLPRWWVWTFILTVIFAVIYYAYYELLGGPSLDDELKAKMAVIEEQRARADAAFSLDTIDEMVLEADRILAGKAIYDKNCFMCHGNYGEGLIGPNLTDHYFIHGHTAKDTFRVIQKGVPEKGMVPWEGMLSNDELVAITAYTLSLIGSNPANPKAPEGVLVE